MGLDMFGLLEIVGLFMGFVYLKRGTNKTICLVELTSRYGDMAQDNWSNLVDFIILESMYS